jgi:CHAD domain-containing protein
MDAMKLSAQQSYVEAAAAVISARSEAVFACRTRDVLDLGEIEGVHAMRVATRRLRAALEVFGPCLAGKHRGRALAEVKTLAAALGERRDRDVQLELLTRLAAECDGSERRALAVLVRELRSEQDEANRDLAKALVRAKRTGLRRRLARLAK